MGISCPIYINRTHRGEAESSFEYSIKIEHISKGKTEI
jgi:hypothetical protein